MNITDELTSYGIVHRIPILFAQGMELLEGLVKENQPKKFLEIGTAIGRTAIAVAALVPDCQVVTIERDPEMIALARKNIEESGMKERITLIEGDAKEVQIPDGPYDFIFIDAAKAQYKPFFEKYAPYLSEDGLILSDNMKFHGLVDHPERTHNRSTKNLIRRLKAYREFLETNEEFTTEFLDEGDGFALTRRKRNA